MKDLSGTLQDILDSKLSAEGYDIVDLIQIPQGGDRMVRMQTIRELLEDFDKDQEGQSFGYLVQIRPKPRRETSQTAAVHSESVYLPDGKLNLPFLVRNAELLFRAGEFALARNLFHSVLQSGERSGYAHFWIARCFDCENRPEEAKKHYEESVAFQPSVECYQYLAAVLIRQKRDHYAAEVLERALRMRGLSTEARAELHKSCGNSWLRADKPAEAETHYRASIEADPASANSEEARLGLAGICQKAGRLEEARRHYEDALAHNPRNPRALEGLAHCHLAAGDKRHAHDCFGKSLELNLQNPTAIYHLVKCAYEIRSYATAARLVGEYIEVAPINANLLYSLAGLQFHLGRLGEAKRTIGRILDIQPEHSGAKELSGMIEKYAGAVQ